MAYEVSTAVRPAPPRHKLLLASLSIHSRCSACLCSALTTNALRTTDASSSSSIALPTVLLLDRREEYRVGCQEAHRGQADEPEANEKLEQCRV